MNLESLYALFARHPEGQWIMQPPNARQLYTFIREHPVKNVLDLGMGIGCSSAVMALAFKDKGETDYRIDTVDQSDKCIALAKDLIPKELQEHVNFYKSNATVCEFPRIPHISFSIYDTLPEHDDYELVINDGPSPFMEGEGYLDLPNGTITKMLLEGKIKSGAYVIWDGRIQALGLLERYCGDNFYISPEQKSDFNILERKDTPVIFRDAKYEAMKSTTYFK